MSEETEKNVESKKEDESTVVVVERTSAADAFARHDVPVEKPVRTRKKSIFNTVLLAVVCILSIVIIFQVSSGFTEGNMKSLPEILSSMDVEYFVIALALLVLLILVDTLKFYVIGRAVSGKSKLLTSCKVGLLGKFYDNITPFASGGQPMQIYYLTKKGYSAGQATGVTLVKFFTQMFTWAIIAGLLMGFNSGVLFKYITNAATRTTIQVLAWVGFGFNLVLPVMIILFVVVPKLATKLTYWTITAAHKLHIVKDKEKALAKAFAIVDDFKNSVKVMAKNPVKFAVLILLCFIEPIVWLAFPYFILVAFASGPDIQPGFQMMIEIMALHIYASNSASIVPTPGNGGVIETTFSLAFASVSGDVLFWVVFMWRFCTYYVYLIVGLCISAFELIRKAVRKYRAKKRGKHS